MIKGLWGINIAVSDLEAAAAKMEAVLGMKPRYTKPEDFAFPGLKGAGFWVNGLNISLIEPEDENTVVGKFIQKKGEGVLLLSFESDDVDNDVEQLRKAGMQFAMPENASGAFGRVNFIHPKSMHGVQVEIIQPSDHFYSLRDDPSE